MEFIFSIKAKNGEHVRSIDRVFLFNEIELLEKSCGLEFPTHNQFPHPAVMLWDVLQEMKKEVTREVFNSDSTNKNDYGVPISVCPDIPII